MDIKDFVGLGGIPLVQALVALTKTSLPELPARYYPGISIAWGVTFNIALAWLLRADLRVSVVVGVVVGLAASGLFQYAKDQSQKLTPQG